MIDAPLALAFTAGMLAAFNPCGFAMLPAYVGYFLGLEQADRRDDATAGLLRAAGVAAVVAGGFVLVFGVAGLLVTRFSVGVQRYAPWLTIVIGLALIPLGVAMLRGFQPKLSLPRFQRGGGDRGLASMFLFGVSYATVSLVCTLPVFLAAVAGTFRHASVLSGIAVFGAYTLGMTVVLVVLTVAVALARAGIVARLKRILPHVNRIAGALLVIAGAYVAYYGWFDIRITSGRDVVTGPADFVSSLSGMVGNWLNRAGAVLVGSILGGVVASIFAGAWLIRRRSLRAVDARDDRVEQLTDA